MGEVHRANDAHFSGQLGTVPTHPGSAYNLRNAIQTIEAIRSLFGVCFKNGWRTVYGVFSDRQRA